MKALTQCPLGMNLVGNSLCWDSTYSPCTRHHLLQAIGSVLIQHVYSQLRCCVCMRVTVGTPGFVEPACINTRLCVCHCMGRNADRSLLLLLLPLDPQGQL